MKGSESRFFTKSQTFSNAKNPPDKLGIGFDEKQAEALENQKCCLLPISRNKN
jgi:hypothetical protein